MSTSNCIESNNSVEENFSIPFDKAIITEINNFDDVNFSEYSGYSCIINFISGAKWLINIPNYDINDLFLADISNVIVGKIVKEWNNDVQFFIHGSNPDNYLNYENPCTNYLNTIFDVIITNDITQTDSFLEDKIINDDEKPKGIDNLLFSLDKPSGNVERYVRLDNTIRHLVCLFLRVPQYLYYLTFDLSEQKKYCNYIFKIMEENDMTEYLFIDNLSSDKPIPPNLIGYFNKCSKLKTLQFFDVNLNDETITQTIFNPISANTNLQISNLKITRGTCSNFDIISENIGNLPLKRLEISKTDIDDDELKTLCHKLINNTTLSFLILEKNINLSINHIDSLAEMLLENNSISELKISIHQNVIEGFGKIRNLVDNINTKNTKLDTIQIDTPDQPHIPDNMFDELFFHCFSKRVKILFFTLT